MWYESDHLAIAVHYGVAEVRVRGPGDWADAVASLERHWGLTLVVFRDLDRLTQPPGRDALDRIGRLPVPTVAHLDGDCVGPATELALACQWRTAVGRAETLIGVEPKPATVARLTELLGRRRALRVLRSPPLTPRLALAAGLLHRAWGPRMAEIHLLSFTLDLSARPRSPGAWRAA